jgi:hypothetical protein
MEASPPRSDTFSRDYKPGPSFERLDADAALGESFSSSTASFSFIDMDPEEQLFSMRWTSSSSEGDGLRFGLPRAAGACSSPLLAASAGFVFSDDSLLLPCDASACSSPAFHTAQSTPAASVASSAPRRPAGGAKPLLATRRILLRYLRFLVPLCRKARALRRLPVPAGRVFFSAPRTRALATATPARRSTSSASSPSPSAAAEYWCHGNADVAVRDAILHCKKSLLTACAEC